MDHGTMEELKLAERTWRAGTLLNGRVRPGGARPPESLNLFAGASGGRPAVAAKAACGVKAEWGNEGSVDG